MEFIVMLVVVIWGMLITIAVVISEYCSWKRMTDHHRRIFKLELKCKNYGKGEETEETKEAGETERTTSEDVG